MPVRMRRDTGTMRVRRLLLSAGLAVCLLAYSAASRGADEPTVAGSQSLTEDQKIVHVLNRLSFGSGC